MVNISCKSQQWGCWQASQKCQKWSHCQDHVPNRVVMNIGVFGVVVELRAPSDGDGELTGNAKRNGGSGWLV